MAVDPQELSRLVAALERPAWMAHLYREQLQVVRDATRFKAVTLPRQTGKTVMLTSLAAEALQAAKFNECVLYLAKTRGEAKTLIWASLHRLNQQHQLGWGFHEAELRIETPAGGYLIVRGAEGSKPSEQFNSIRGITCRRALLDEPANYSETIGPLLSEVVEPAIDIPQGDVIIAGTPGYICKGHWFEISTGKRRGWSTYHWSGDKNPARKPGYLEAVRAEKGYTEDDPHYQIEWLGKWTVSDALQVYRYVESRNCVDAIPGYDRDTWVHSVGVDFGQTDDCAWVAVASPPHERDVYVIAAHKEKGLSPSQCADITKDWVTKYRPDVLVGDGGNLGGNVYIQAINERLGSQTSVYMTSAQKSEKRAYQELINGDFRALSPDGKGRLRLLRGATDALAEELTFLPWSNSTRTAEHKAYDNHLCDALLYAWRHHSAYLHEAPARAPRTPRAGEPGYEEWLEALELEQYQKQASKPWWEK